MLKKLIYWSLQAPLTAVITIVLSLIAGFILAVHFAVMHVIAYKRGWDVWEGWRADIVSFWAPGTAIFLLGCLALPTYIGPRDTWREAWANRPT